MKSTINCDKTGSHCAQAIRQKIQQQWRDLWDYRFQDKWAAEDVARKTYDLLYIEKGTVIQATKNYQPPNLSNILKLNEKTLRVRLTYPDPNTGGWHKFYRQVLAEQPRWRNNIMKRKMARQNEKNALQRKGGRGWLNS